MIHSANVMERIDAIAKRQTARFLDHLRDTRQATPRLEADVMRVFGFIFSDVKQAIKECVRHEVP
jgi:hypothetical protein